MFGSVKSGTTLPGGSSLTAHASTTEPLSAILPASTRSAEISHAIFGLTPDLLLLVIADFEFANPYRGAHQRSPHFLTLIIGECRLPHRLDEGDFIDLLQGRQTKPNLIECRLAQEAHAFFARRPPDLG